MSSNQVDHLLVESSQLIGSVCSPITSPQESTFSNLLMPVSPKNGTNCLMPPTIPTRSENAYRTLIICFDGTGDQFDSDVGLFQNSNIVDFFRLLKNDDQGDKAWKQLVFYRPGKGIHTTPQAYATPQKALPLFSTIRKLVDETVAWDYNLNLRKHIADAYKFLMDNHSENDRICIFGFSRGAYTARCLAGMIHKAGLLPAGNDDQIPTAYEMYMKDDAIGLKDFKRIYNDVDDDLKFLGVWDSVNLVGLIPRCPPFPTSNPVVRTFRHAVSLDERRVKFKTNTWNWTRSITNPGITKEAHANGKSGVNHYQDTRQPSPPDVDEVWFAGCHSDVGGGSVENGINPRLSRISLRWMIRECFKSNSGISFHTDGLREIGLDPASLYPYPCRRPPAITIDSSPDPKVFIAEAQKSFRLTTTVTDNPTSGEELLETEEVAEFHDSLAPIYDPLSQAWFWWILEFILWHTIWFSWNLGSGRDIPGQSSTGVRVHRSVKTRLEAEHRDGRKYIPKANLEMKYVTWVD